MFGWFSKNRMLEIEEGKGGKWRWYARVDGDIRCSIWHQGALDQGSGQGTGSNLFEEQLADCSNCSNAGGAVNWGKFQEIVKRVAPVGQALGAGTPVGAIFGIVEQLTKERDVAPDAHPDHIAQSEIEKMAVLAPIIREILKRALGPAAIKQLDAFADAWDYAAEHEEESMTELRKETNQLLERYEARKKTPYICPAGFWTIGIGHNLEAVPVHGWSKSDPKNLTLNDVEIEDLLSQDVTRAERDLPRLGVPTDSLPEVAKEVLLRMCFQMGVGGVRAFVSLRKALNLDPPDFRWAAREMRDSKWWKSDSRSRAEDEAKRMESLA